jgi:hypothetical protein
MHSEIRSTFISVSHYSHLPLLIILATTFTLCFSKKNTDLTCVLVYL